MMFKNIFYFTRTFTAVFVLSETIRKTEDTSEFDFIIKAFDKEPQKLLVFRYFKRILVSLLDKCSDEQLKWISNIMNLQNTLVAHLSDRFSIYVLLIISKRNECAIATCLRQHLEEKLADLLLSSQFGFFLANLEYKDLKSKLMLHVGFIKALKAPLHLIVAEESLEGYWKMLFACWVLNTVPLVNGSIYLRNVLDKSIQILSNFVPL